MTWPFRVTSPLLDVVETLTQVQDRAHGWDLATRCGQSAPNVYRALERLRQADWVAYEWEESNPEPGKPRRRFYWLTEVGRAEAPRLLAERRKPRGTRILGPTILGLFSMMFDGAR